MVQLPAESEVTEVISTNSQGKDTGNQGSKEPLCLNGNIFMTLHRPNKHIPDKKVNCKQTENRESANRLKKKSLGKQRVSDWKMY